VDYCSDRVKGEGIINTKETKRYLPTVNQGDGKRALFFLFFGFGYEWESLRGVKGVKKKYSSFLTTFVKGGFQLSIDGY